MRYVMMKEQRDIGAAEREREDNEKPEGKRDREKKKWEREAKRS